jgi:hypothetical protein
MDTDKRRDTTDYYTAPTHKRERGPGWSWLLLLPLFFVLGWAANSAYYNGAVGSNANTGVRYGVGGGPGETTITNTTPIPNQYNPNGPTIRPTTTTNPAMMEDIDRVDVTTEPTTRASATPSAAPTTSPEE